MRIKRFVKCYCTTNELITHGKISHNQKCV